MRWLDRPILLGAPLLALVAFLAWIAMHGLWSFLDGLTSGADWIDLNTGSAGAAAAAVAIGCWSAILPGLPMTDRTERWIMRLSFACVPMLGMLPTRAIESENA